MPNSDAFNSVVNFKSLFAAIATPCLVLTPDLFIVEVNEAYLQVTQKKRDQLLGQYVFDVFPDNPEDPSANGVNNLRSSLERVINTCAVDRMPEQKYDVQLGNSDDGKYQERYWDAVNIPVLDEDGQLSHILHQVGDITSRVLYERALLESETRLGTLINSIPDVVYYMSPDWEQLRHLQGRGFIKNTVSIDKYWIDAYIPPEHQPLIHRAIDTAIERKQIFELEHKVRRVDGTYGWALSRAVPMLDKNGNIIEWIGAATDITQRKELEEKLKNNDRQKDEFLAMLAHELRNPLAPINAAAELLQIVRLDEVRVRQTSQIISRQVKHMASLVDDLLDVSRVSTGLIELDNVPLDIRDIVSDALEQTRPLIESRRHHLSLHLPPSIAEVMGDRKRLVQVVTNILNNAAKYTQEGGNIMLNVEAHAEKIIIEIEDNGIGMSPALTVRAFDLFAQAERSSDRSSGGLGLGLALVKSLVNLHGGTVMCESAGLGKGSKFSVCLPRLPHEQSDTGQQHVEGSTHPQINPLVVLVVDDNVDAASLLAMLLETGGHEVLVEHNSHRALELARNVAPEVCLLDIGLPEMDGIELAKRLRAAPATATSTLIAVTGYGQEQDRQQTLAAGFDHHLVKPVDFRQLTSLLEEISEMRLVGENVKRKDG